MTENKAKKQAPPDKYRVILLDEYLATIMTFTGDKIKEALRLIYNNHKVMEKFEYQGRHYFIVEE